MSLNYDLSEIENYKEVCWIDPPEGTPGFMISESGKMMNLVTHNLIFATLVTGHGWELTEANVAEFYARLRLWDQMNGFDSITIEEVRAHIGLRTNAGNPESRSKWLSRIVGPQLDDYKREFKKEKLAK